jgi:hypothetical protein
MSGEAELTVSHEKMVCRRLRGLYQSSEVPDPMLFRRQVLLHCIKTKATEASFPAAFVYQPYCQFTFM